MDIIKRINAILDKKGWNQSRLARECGQAPDWVSKRIGGYRQERGKSTDRTPITIDDLALMAHALHVSMCELFPDCDAFNIRKLTVYDFLQSVFEDFLRKKNIGGCDEKKSGKDSDSRGHPNRGNGGV